MADDRQARDDLRRSLRAQRAALSLDDVLAASRLVCAQLTSLSIIRRAQSVALYAAIRNEIDLEPLRQTLHARKVLVCYPRVVSKKPPRQSFQVVAADETMPIGSFGIHEPRLDAPELAPEVIIVPALGLSRDGHRLGWGMGHYDAALEQHPNALRIGVAHDFQLIAPFATHEGDEPVDLIQTPRERIVTGARAFAPEEVLS